MCGLIGWVSRNGDIDAATVSDYVAEQFEDQKARGKEGFGLVEIDDEGYVRVQRSTGEIKMMTDLRLTQARHVFLHHRNPTSTSNSIQQTHPIVVEHEELENDWLVMHNGVIRNPAELKTKHEALGYKYTTYDEEQPSYKSKFNDSEAFAIELARFLEKKSDEIGTHGPAAFMAVSSRAGRVVRVFIGTNGNNPMKLDTYDVGFHFASSLKDAYEVEVDTAYEFIPFFKDKMLTGFKKKKEAVALKFASYVAPAPARYAGKDDERTTSTPNVPQVPRMGFGRKEVDEDPRDAVMPDAKDIFSYSQILEMVKRSELGAVFTDKKAAKHQVLEAFDYDKFAGMIRTGKLDEADQYWEEFKDEMYMGLDLDAALTEALVLDPGMTPGLNTKKNIKEAQVSIGDRMRVVAAEFLPIFRLVSFVEAVLKLSYDYSMHDKGRKSDTPKPTSIAVYEIDPVYKAINDHRFQYGQVHQVDKCNKPKFHTENVAIELHQQAWGAFPHTVELCKQPQWHRTDAVKPSMAEFQAHFQAFGEAHQVDDCIDRRFHKFDTGTIISAERSEMVDNIVRAARAKGMDDIKAENEARDDVNYQGADDELDVMGPTYAAEQEAAASLDVFESASESMDPDAILEEADQVSELVRTAASVAIEEQLLMMKNIAAEEGLDFKIGKIEDEILNIVVKTSKRLSTVANIVKAAKQEDEAQSAMDFHI